MLPPALAEQKNGPAKEGYRGAKTLVYEPGHMREILGLAAVGVK